jgi:hypothetical protein
MFSNTYSISLPHIVLPHPVTAENGNKAVHLGHSTKARKHDLPRAYSPTLQQPP